MAQRLTSVDENYMFPEPLEDRLDRKNKAYADETKLPKVGIRLTQEHLDTLREPGSWFQPNNADATPENGYPFPQASTVLVEKYSPQFVNLLMIVKDVRGTQEARRTLFNNGTWSEWYIYKMSDRTSLATQHLDTLGEGRYVQSTTATATPANGYPFMAASFVDVDSYSKRFVNLLMTVKDVEGRQEARRHRFNNGAWSEWRFYKPIEAIRLNTEHLDTLRSPGDYYQPSTANATPERGYPFVGACYVAVESYSQTFVNRTMTVRDAEGKQEARRSLFNNGTWGAWSFYRPAGASTDPIAGTGIGAHQHMMRLNDLRRRIGQPRTNGKAAVALIADHGSNNFNEIVVPILRETGIRATIALNSQMYDPAAQRYAHDNRTSWEIVKSWHDQLGVEIANHGRTHKDQATVEGIRNEIVNGRKELEANLPGVNIDTYVQVGLSGTSGFMGHNNGKTLESYYETEAGRIIADSHALFTGTIPSNRIHPLDGHPVQGHSSYWIDGGATGIAEAKAAIQEAITKGYGTSVRFHPELLNTEGYLTTAQLQNFARYLKSLVDAGDIVSLTHRELALASSAPDEATTRQLVAML